MKTIESEPSELIRIWIIEDDTVYRNKIADWLDEQSDLVCTGRFPDLESVLTLVNESTDWETPEVVLLDLELPGLSGLEGLPRLNHRLIDTAIVILTHHSDTDQIFAALQAGASGYLVKNASFAQLALAIAEAAQGGMLLPAPVARKVLGHFNQTLAAEDFNLTPRELEVLLLMTEGFRHEQISEKLLRSPYTIGNHIRNIYRKLHVHSALEAVAKARKHGLIQWAKRHFIPH